MDTTRKSNWLAVDLSKAARHPFFKPLLPGQHRQSPDIKALGSWDGTTLIDITILQPLSAGRLAGPPREPNPLLVLNVARARKVSRFPPFMRQARTCCGFFPIQISKRGYWHTGTHRAVLSSASGIVSSAMELFSIARGILF